MNRVPRQLPGCDIRALPLRPSEAYLLSRIDSAVSERELSLITGLSQAEVEAALDRLLELGAIHFVGANGAPMPGGPPKSDATMPPPALLPPPAATKEPPRANRPEPPHARLRAQYDSPQLYDPAELDEVVDLEVEKKRRILDAFYRLDDFTYYELLNISEQADKKQIKSAYYQAAPEFHPDRFFRKNLGSYKPKIEAIFARITLAHDVLTSKERRAEYDEYLEQTHRNRAMSALIDEAPRIIASVASAVEESAAAIAGAPGGYSPPTAGRYGSEPRAPESLQSRRDTLARKLGGRAPRPAGMGPPGAAPADEASRDPRAGGEALRARYQAARAEALRLQLRRYVDAARASLDRKDYASAANAYRIAASLAPEDAELQKTCAATAQLAATALADGFMKQAEYEAQAGRWADAALSYSKVCTGLPNDARAHERASYATIKASGNVRRAIDLARRAVELSPKTAEFHVTLARAYSAAGLENSAAVAIDRAAELAPKDARIKELIARARERPPKDGKVS
jgi:curved DNA-binding protein CbpA